MRRFVILSSMISMACGPAGAPPSPVSTQLEVLRHSIDSLVNDQKFANAQIGLLIVDPKTGDTIYSRNAGKLFMPASNQKIITSAVALTQLGPDYRYHTIIAKRGTVKDSVLNGDLIV